MARRFDIALSFPGEYREFVAGVAEHVAAAVGRERVLYDTYHEADFTRLDLDIYLPRLYRNESELVAVFLCSEYRQKAWCQLEWRHIRQLIATADAYRIMLLSFGKPGDLSEIGILPGDGYVDIAGRNPASIASLILQRLRGTLPKARTAPWESSPFSASRLPRTGDDLFGRDSDVTILDEAWANPTTCIIQIVAPGGVGKTQLVKKWRERLLASADHGGAVRAFDWSFYSQGTQQQASSDEFLDRALRWFGEPKPENYIDPWAKGERLAELVKQQRTLLILDGLEPLQHPPGPMAGELSDPAIQALLEALRWGNPGLCIVTTREAVRVLNEIAEPTRRTIDLTNLSSEAGAGLLRKCGVTGDPDKLRQASVDVNGHALALILLGTYLKLKCRGDVNQRSEALLFQGHERYAAHAHKVMASYETWLERQDHLGPATVAILRLMGLFNRPADLGCLAALRAEPPIPGLTEALFLGDHEQTWNRAVERLRAARLLTDETAEQANQGEEKSQLAPLQLCSHCLIALDAHPLIREHFAIQLTERFLDAEREAHRRLYEHLTHRAVQSPDSVCEMMLLFHAVSHGTKAGLHQRVLDEVLKPRVFRGWGKDNMIYSAVILGMWVPTLASLRSFLAEQSSHLSCRLSDEDHGFVLTATSFCLRSLCRFTEAIEIAKIALAWYVERNNAEAASLAARILNQTYIAAGNLGLAQSYGEQSVDWADRAGGISDQRFLSRTRLAESLHHAGKLQDAQRVFVDAAAITPDARLHFDERGVGKGRVNSFARYEYYDFLLTLAEEHEDAGARQSEYQGLKARLDEMLDREEDQHQERPLYNALIAALRGRLFILMSREMRGAERHGFCLMSHQEFKRSIGWFKTAGQRQHLCLGLLGTAESLCELDQILDADEVLSQAKTLAAYGTRLHQADRCLLSALCELKKGTPSAAWPLLEEARKLISDTGYGRRVTALRRLEMEVISALHEETFDKAQGEYAMRISSDDEQVRRLAARISNALTMYVRLGDSRILELGPGSGHLARCLSEKGHDVTAVEQSSQMCALVKQTSPKTRLINADFRKQSFGTERYSCVIAIAFIHLFPSWYTSVLLEKVRQILRPGGIAVLSTTVHDESAEGFFEKGDYEGKYIRFRHFFTELELRNTLRKVGFSIVDYSITRDLTRHDKVWMELVVQKPGQA